LPQCYKKILLQGLVGNSSRVIHSSKQIKFLNKKFKIISDKLFLFKSQTNLMYLKKITLLKKNKINQPCSSRTISFSLKSSKKFKTTINSKVMKRNSSKFIPN
jgi:hypothetical protein